MTSYSAAGIFFGQFLRSRRKGRRAGPAPPGDGEIFLRKSSPCRRFDREYVKMLDGKHVKKAEQIRIALQIKDDIAKFKTKHGCSRMVMLWCGSTEIFLTQDDVHTTPENLRRP